MRRLRPGGGGRGLRGPGRDEGLGVSRVCIGGMIEWLIDARSMCDGVLCCAPRGAEGRYGSICAVKCPVLCSAMRYDAQEQRRQRMWVDRTREGVWRDGPTQALIWAA